MKRIKCWPEIWLAIYALVKTYSLEEINRAAEDAEEGNTLKSVLRMEQP